MRLGERLVHDQKITVQQLEIALRAQVIYGARLGTNLVELGHVDLDTISVALADQLGVPAAMRKHFEQVDPAVLRMVPARLAEKHQAVPLGLARLSGRQLVVALIDPYREESLFELASATGIKITPCVAPELRLLYYLERFYGVPRKNRYLRLAVKGGRAVEVERRRTLDDEGGDPPPLPPPPRADAEPLPPPPGPARVPTQPAGARPALSAHDAMVAIGRAQRRDEIGDAIVDYLRSAFGCGLVLIDKDGLALGWKGFAPGPDPTRVEAVVLPLSAPSMFHLVHEARGLFRGAPPSKGALVQGRFYKLLMVPPPREVVVAPVILAGRVVNLLYAHAVGGGPLPDHAAAEILAVGAAAATAYARLIQAAKHP